MAPAAQHTLHPTFTATPGSVRPTGGQAYVVILSWGPCAKGRLQGGAPVNVSQAGYIGTRELIMKAKLEEMAGARRFGRPHGLDPDK